MGNKIFETLVISTLFRGLAKEEIEEILRNTDYRIREYEKDETVFHLMEDAEQLGIILEGYVQAQKFFPNGSQINVSVKGKGELIGPAAVFSKQQKYPCDIIALEDSRIMMIRKSEIITMMQKDGRILQNFAMEISSATYMLQQRLELLSYNGISQKIAFYLLIQERKTDNKKVRIPESMTNWAMIMNVSRPSLHRELKKMNNEGVITYSPPYILINDNQQLQDMLSR